MNLAKNRKGFLFTVAAIMLIVPLIYLISFYGTISDTQMDDAVGKIRCDELHYFVEDTKKDMERAVSIFGRRAALSAIDDIVTTGIPLKNYKFNCTSKCQVDCNTFKRPKNGSEAAIAELIVCGTLYGVPVKKMENNTLPLWIERMNGEGRHMGFAVNITASEIKIIPRDAWHFAIISDNKINASDRMGLCYYSQNVVTAISNTSIIGLEDPLYLMKNYEKKIIQNCSPENVLPNIPAGCGTSGAKSGGGFAILYFKNVTSVGVAAFQNYCGGGSIVPSTGDVNTQALLWNDGSGTCSSISSCLNASKPNHFAAVITYSSTDFLACSVTIPVIEGTGDMDTVLPLHYGGDPKTECSAAPIFYDDCIYTVHYTTFPPFDHVMFGRSSDDFNTSCYYVSDVDKTWTYSSCAADYPNGPSFFDRLDGSINLSETYVNQSLEYFGTSLIGIESFVDLPMMAYMRSIGYKVKVNDTLTWTDYLYWANKTGCSASAYCSAGNYSVKMDCVHAYRYGMPTECGDGIMLPNCGDDVCSVAESYRTCPKSTYYSSGDCTCPAGCIQNATLTACNISTGCGVGTSKVEFKFNTYDCMNALANASSSPFINATWTNGLLHSGVKSKMTNVSKGRYKYETNCIDNTYLINATAVDLSGSCLPIVKTELFGLISGLSPC